MIKNYFRVAVRFLLKNKTFSFINIIGLAIGTLCCMYILLYVRDQYSYDRHRTNAKDIYRVTTDLKLRNDQHNNATSSPPIAPAIKNDFGEVLQFTRLATFRAEQRGKSCKFIKNRIGKNIRSDAGKNLII